MSQIAQDYIKTVAVRGNRMGKSPVVSSLSTVCHQMFHSDWHAYHAVLVPNQWLNIHDYIQNLDKIPSYLKSSFRREQICLAIPRRILQSTVLWDNLLKNKSYQKIHCVPVVTYKQLITSPTYNEIRMESRQSLENLKIILYGNSLMSDENNMQI